MAEYIRESRNRLQGENKGDFVLNTASGTRMDEYFENYLTEEARAIGKTVAEVMAWTPTVKVKKAGRKAKAAAK